MSEVKYNDLKSPTLSPDDYLDSYQDKPVIISNFEEYIPNQDTLVKVKTLLREKNQKLKIIAFGAEWCPDCSKNVPCMIKIIKTLDSNDISLEILYGIMVNAFHKVGDVIWHKKRSPPEAVDPKFGLKALPTFYFFDKTDDLIGKIVEHPKSGSTIEEDMLEILKKRI